MERYVILLRGVMPTGKNKVPMARLREVMADAGYLNPRTWIQSGNLILDSGKSREATGEHVRELIHAQIGPELALAALTAEEIQETLDNNPFQQGYDQARVFYGFFTRPPAQQALDRIRDKEWTGCEARLGNGAVYMYIPMDYTKAPLNAGALEKLAGVPVTMRNANTLSKLVAMCRES